jgi:hypothetical protein|tara:strand:+ start:102 stop:515 length:414 start_codon:yes stop_codon:yes gene_type:complete
MSTVKAANLQNTGSGAPTFKNSSGTEIGQLCKAWVNFNGTGTVAIRDSFNVGSITDHAVGEYQINFTSNMANSNYCAVCACSGTNANNAVVLYPSSNLSGVKLDDSYRSASMLRLLIVNGAGQNIDNGYMNVAIFGD